MVSFDSEKANYETLLKEFVNFSMLCHSGHNRQYKIPESGTEAERPGVQPIKSWHQQD